MDSDVHERWWLSLGKFAAKMSPLRGEPRAVYANACRPGEKADDED